MIKARKRPYHADCIQWDGTNFSEIEAMVDGEVSMYGPDHVMIRHGRSINTLSIGRWVVRGENGVVKAYSDAEFRVKYEVVE